MAVSFADLKVANWATTIRKEFVDLNVNTIILMGSIDVV